MCTSIVYSSNNHHYFGRNLDLEISFGEHPVITPRNYEFQYRKLPNKRQNMPWLGWRL